MPVIVDYTFDSAELKNPDGSLLTNLPRGASIVAGPGPRKAVDLGGAPAIDIDISSIDLPLENLYHVKLFFNLDGPFEGHQILAQSDRIPFKLGVFGRSPTVYLEASTCTTVGSWQSSTDHEPVTPGEWHSADLIYDNDTLVLFLDSRAIACHGFGRNRSLAFDPSARTVSVGGLNASTRFHGRIACFSLSTDLPLELRTSCLRQRETPQWNITTKLETLRPYRDLGEEFGDMTFLNHLNSYLQPYRQGAIVYHEGTGAFEMLLPVYLRYMALSQPAQDSLGHLISDSLPSEGEGHKSAFHGGAIYCNKETEAFEVLGQNYKDYSATGGPHSWGYPLDQPLPVNNGTFQRFEKATFYHKSGCKCAHEVHGPILQAFVSTGGLGKWGFPHSNTQRLDVDGHKGRDVLMSNFERGSFYWSESTGAHAVQGKIRQKWQTLGGPDMHFIQELGLPTTDEIDVPRVIGGRVSGFEQGVILWYGEREEMKVVYPFKIFIEKLETTRSTNCSAANANHLYFTVILNEGESTVFCQRYPKNEGFGNKECLEVNEELPLVLKPKPDVKISLTVDVWDAHPKEHEHVGTWVKTFDTGNAWEMTEDGGKLSSGAFGKVKDIQLAVRPEIG